jgi:2,4-dienoyl-CoA reductase-like NADH-dependent reductase (Old Yellow Enzyme family)
VSSQENGLRAASAEDTTQTEHSEDAGTVGFAALFRPVMLGALALRNRVVVAPMTRQCATDDGRATQGMARYYARFAQGGFGLVIAEGTYIDLAHSQGYVRQPGITTLVQTGAWRRVTDEVHRDGGHIVLQLMHAGALVQGNRFTEVTVAPTAMQPAGERQAAYDASGPYPVPRALSMEQIAAIVAAFAAAAGRARVAGFDGVEVHAGNGFLLHQFASASINRRDDVYGGSLAGRIRLLVEVVRAARQEVGAGYVVGIRLSQHTINDPARVWSGGELEAATIMRAAAVAGATYIHVAARQAMATACGTGTTLSALARRH